MNFTYELSVFETARTRNVVDDPLFCVAESDCVYESSTAVNVNTCDPPPPTTVACADTTAPFTVPSFGVTSTDTVSPASPFPATDRSSVSVSDAVEAVVFTATPSTFHTYVSDTVSPASASVLVAVAVRVAFVPGSAGANDTVAVGAVFWIVTAAEVTGALCSDPSLAVTRRLIASPLSPFPSVARFNVAVVPRAIGNPPLSH